MESNIEIKLYESIIIGSWKIKDGKVVADEVCQRIEKLITDHLKKVLTKKTGWEVLYQDKNDNRHWLLIYPKADWQGCGPPTLKMLSEKEFTESFELLK